MREVTQILTAIEKGDARASDELLPLVYQELRRLAAQRMKQEKPGQTLQATALVHEAYIRLVGSESQNWNSRAHFFAAAAEAMRRILIENARRKRSLKYGGDRQRVDLDEAVLAGDSDIPSDKLIALDEALERLSKIDRAKAELVKLRYFAGLTGESPASGHFAIHSGPLLGVRSELATPGDYQGQWGNSGLNFILFQKF